VTFLLCFHFYVDVVLFGGSYCLNGDKDI